MTNNRLKGQVSHTIEQHALLNDGCKVAVALSGGADSVALLLVLKELGYRVSALHCNFHLRGEESNRDETFVAQLCLSNSIELHIAHFDTFDYALTNGVSIEMAARTLRYEWFARMLKQLGLETIAVAHHRQDQAETILLNLLRGTGLRGLCGMHYSHLWTDKETGVAMRVVRPLLDVSRVEIEDYLRHRGQEWVTDSTNNEREALRNRIRLDVLPLLQTINPRATENIASIAQRMQETLVIYERGLQGEQPRTGKGESKPGQKAIVCHSLTALHEHLRGLGFTASQEQDIWNARIGAIVDSQTHSVLKDRNGFIIKAKDAATALPTWHSEDLSADEFYAIPRAKLKEEQATVAYFDHDAIRTPLTMRWTQAGDRFTPFGMKGTKLVSDLLTDLKVDRFAKGQQAVLCDADGCILWVVGRRAANTARVTEQTTNVLRISTE